MSPNNRYFLCTARYTSILDTMKLYISPILETSYLYAIFCVKVLILFIIISHKLDLLEKGIRNVYLIQQIRHELTKIL